MSHYNNNKVFFRLLLTGDTFRAAYARGGRRWSVIIGLLSALETCLDLPRTRGVHFKYEGKECSRVCCDITVSPPCLLSNNSDLVLNGVQLDLQEKLPTLIEKIKPGAPKESFMSSMFSEVHLVLRYLSLSGVTKPSGMLADMWTHHLTF